MKVVFTDNFKRSLNRTVWRRRLEPFNLAQYKRRIKWFIQRGRRGYSDRDLWNADIHIAETAKAFLQKETTGYPFDLSEKRWEHVKGEMLWLMNEHLNDNTPTEVWKTDAYQKRYKRARQYFGKYWVALWD